eukprot:275569-Amphidinium_carterae.1
MTLWVAFSVSRNSEACFMAEVSSAMSAESFAVSLRCMSLVDVQLELGTLSANQMITMGRGARNNLARIVESEQIESAKKHILQGEDAPH